MAKWMSDHSKKTGVKTIEEPSKPVEKEKKKKEKKVVTKPSKPDVAEKVRTAFTDEEFKADMSSLTDSDAPKPDWRVIEWIRAGKIAEFIDNQGQIKIFRDEISPRDIKKGGIGDRYFLSVLSALAERPNRIRKLFDLERTELGYWVVYYYINGYRREVIMDNYLACKDKKLYFAHCRGRGLWVSILEKAWAKVHGNYWRIDGGYSYEAMRALTGAPSYNYLLNMKKG